MLNYLWGAMIILGVVYGLFSGNITAVADGALDSAKEAVTLCITMLGVMSLWTGLMQIASKSGLIAKCMKLIGPVMHWLFPQVPRDHKAMEYMTTNVIANILGLGWAATPAGIKAMEQLAELEHTDLKDTQLKGGQLKGMQSKDAQFKDTEDVDKRCHHRNVVASDAMCAFLVINISSLQLIPVNIIAYRSQYGSVNPTAVVGPGLVATLISTAAGIIVCRLMCKRGIHKSH